MSAGTPLNDDDRWPWLAAVGASLGGKGAAIASCSALKRGYREAIAKAAQRPILFIYLHGSKEVLQRRINARQGHFMPASLLDSQLKTLEPPGPDEQALELDIEQSMPQLVERAHSWILEQR